MHPHVAAEASRLRSRELAREARRYNAFVLDRPARTPAPPRRMAGNLLIAAGERLVGRPPDLEPRRA